MKTVVKFGGSSLASARQFKKVGDIIPVSYTHLAQDEATITVIATGLTDKTLSNTPVAKAMKDFSNPYKSKPVQKLSLIHI